MEKEEVIVYLAAAKEVVSAILMTEREAKQMPIYFISRALHCPEINYTPMKKLVLDLVHATRNISERIDLSRLHSGASGRRSPRFDATNNEVEYEALIAGLRIAEQMGVKNLQTNVDSRLVANQVLVKELNEKSINEAEVLAVVKEEGDTWMTPIYNYLTEETLPAEKEKKLDKIKDSNRQTKQLEDLTDRMRECKRLIKEFEREIREEKSINSPTVTNYQSTLGNKRGELIDMGAGSSEPIADDYIYNISLAPAATLKGQTEQMGRIVNDLDTIHFSVKKASRLVNEIGRQIVHPENKDIRDIPGLAPPALIAGRLLYVRSARRFRVDNVLRVMWQG
ncbi:reverse transcriptase domain-containing protein [Tanacetum coccineum]